MSVKNGIKCVANGNISFEKVLLGENGTEVLLKTNNIRANIVEKNQHEKYLDGSYAYCTSCMLCKGLILSKREINSYKDLVEVCKIKGGPYLLTLITSGQTHVEDGDNNPQALLYSVKQTNAYFHKLHAKKLNFHIPKNQRVCIKNLLIDKQLMDQLMDNKIFSSDQIGLLHKNLAQDAENPIGIPISLNQTLLNTIESLFSLYELNEVSVPLLKIKLLELLTLLEISFKNQICTKSPTDDSLQSKFDSIKTWIENNFSEDFTLKTLARQFGVNEFVLKTEFKKRFGYSVRQFAIEQRMQAAKILVLKNEEPIAHIASALGYKSVSYFTQSFKKHFGITPSEMTK